MIPKSWSLNNSVLSKFFTRISGDHERTNKAYKNIIGSFLIKGLNILISFILVPLTLGYIDPTRYGIWIAISSVINWFGFFDIGLGNGLKNKFAEALAKKEYELARIYLSTTYAVLSLIIIAALSIYFLISPYLDWANMLNVPQGLESELRELSLVVITFFSLRFVLKLITTVLSADQRSAKAESFDFIGKLFTLVIIYFLTIYAKSSLVYLALVMAGMPVVVLMASTIWFFNGRYKKYKPKLSFIRFSYAKGLMNLGVKFFVIQIAALFLYQTNNIIISQLFGPGEVTPYNIAFKYFSVISLGFSIIVSPLWSAFTEAHVTNDFLWIKNIFAKLKKIWFGLVLAGGVLLILSQYFYSIWIGDKVMIPFMMSALVFFYTIVNTWNSIFSIFLNGIGQIKIQLILSIVSALLYVPLAISFGKEFGINGILIANIIILLPTSVILSEQSKRIINKMNVQI